MASRYKKITISISNNELDAMEDFLFCQLPKKEEEKSRKKSSVVWHRLVRAFDKNKR